MGLVVLSETSPRRAIESIIRRSAYILVPFSLLLIKYFPAYGVAFADWSGKRMWVGVATQKNGLGRICMVVSLYFIWSLIRRWQGNNPRIWKYQTHLELLVFLMAIWLLKGPGLGAYSATSIIALGMSLIICSGFYLAKKRGILVGFTPLIIIIIAIMVYGIIVVYTGEVKFGSLTASMGRNETLTDRTAIWARIVPEVKRRPLLGIGFGGFWTPKTRSLFRISGAHSGIPIYCWSSVSPAFFSFLPILFRLAGKRIGYYPTILIGTLWIGYIVMLVVHNITESSINSLAMQLPAIILFLTLTYSNTSQKGDSPSEARNPAKLT